MNGFLLLSLAQLTEVQDRIPCQKEYKNQLPNYNHL